MGGVISSARPPAVFKGLVYSQVLTLAPPRCRGVSDPTVIVALVQRGHIPLAGRAGSRVESIDLHHTSECRYVIKCAPATPLDQPNRDGGRRVEPNTRAGVLVLPLTARGYNWPDFRNRGLSATHAMRFSAGSSRYSSVPPRRTDRVRYHQARYIFGGVLLPWKGAIPLE